MVSTYRLVKAKYRHYMDSVDSMSVSILDSPDSDCDDFVRGIVNAKLCHMPAWTDMIERAFGHKGFYLVAREGSAVCGVFPLTQVRSRLFGNRLISQAFGNYGGPLAKNRAALDALYEHAVELATQHGCESMALKNVEALPYDLHRRTDKITVYLPLAPDSDEVWKRLGHKIRNRVRKADKSGIIVSSGGAEMLDDFYRVWTIRMRQLGTPCYPRKLFSNILETFSDNCRIFLARLGNRTVGANFVYFFNGLVQVRWGGVLVEYNRLAPTTFLFWSIAKHYCGTGAKYLDFGTSTSGSGQEEFKRRWRGQSIHLHYQYWVPPGRELSMISPDIPRYVKKVQIWKRLPLWVTRIVGPHISRNLP